MTGVGFRNQSKTAPAAATQPTAWLPSDVGLLCANFDLPSAKGGGGINQTYLMLAKLHIRSAITLSTLWFGVGGSASGTGTVNAGVYSQAGALLSGCGDVHSQFVLTEYAECPLTTPQKLSSWVWVTLLSNMSGGQAQPYVGQGTAETGNLALPANQSEYACGGTGFSALPANLNFANFPTYMAVAIQMWVGGS